jgi:chorismate dehydratase
MDKIRISAVSYLNTVPFAYGIRNSEIYNHISLSMDIPSVCAEKLIHSKVDLGLVPVAALLEMKEYHIVSDYCIGAEGPVQSVMLMSQVPLHEIKSIYLDYQSATSVLLNRILALKFWKLDVEWLPSGPGYEDKIKDTTAAVIIGDRVFTNRNKYAYKFDLAEEWKNFTGLPFVFAVWASNIKLPSEFINSFNDALSYGLAHKAEALKEWKNNIPSDLNALDYLENNISYNMNDQKKKAMELFLSYARELKKPTQAEKTFSS